MAPFGFDWLSFAAIAVTLASIIAAVGWAVFARKKGEDDEI